MRKKSVSVLIILSLIMTLWLPAGVREADAASKTIHVLMIGNSFTRSRDGTNSTVKHLERLAYKQGVTLDISILAWGSVALWKYSDRRYLKSYADREIRKDKWDYIVLQENQDVAIGGYSTYLNGVRKLTNMIKEDAPKAKILLNAVWPENRTGRFGGTYYNKRQQKNKIFWNTDKVAAAVGIPRKQIIYSGKAIWEYENMTNKGTREDMYRDREHLTDNGYYVNALCIGQRILPRTVYGTRWYASTTRYEALLMMKGVVMYHKK